MGFGFVSGTSQSLAVSGDGSIVAVDTSLRQQRRERHRRRPRQHHAASSGAIYVFRRQPDNAFVKEAFVKARGAAPLDRFGVGRADGVEPLGRAQHPSMPRGNAMQAPADGAQKGKRRSQ